MQLNLRSDESRRILDQRIADKAAFAAKLEAKGFKTPQDKAHWKVASDNDIARAKEQADKNFPVDGGYHQRIIQKWIKGNQRVQLTMYRHDNRAHRVAHFKRATQHRVQHTLTIPEFLGKL